jgi:two-component system osmolarity sensor histidine kinase EnvZ
VNGWAVARLARRLNRPLAALSQATLRLRDGEHDTRLDEGDGDPEMRQVHAGFNRVAREIERIEHDRALMLAGLSHDLRTPLARLRLEAELSVPDPQARSLMAADIETLDRLIGKFADYARPQQRVWEPVPLRLAVEHAAATFDVTIPPCPLALTVSVDPTLNVMGDPTEVLRVLRNLLQNASRHGRTPSQKATRVTIRARRQRAWVDLEVRDHGPGVPAAQLDRLTVPFFRGDTARTDAPGSGLGLAIVEQAVRRMDGSVQLRNAPDGGLLVQIRLLAGPDAPRSGHDATDRGRTDRARTDLAEKALSGGGPGRREGRRQAG